MPTKAPRVFFDVGIGDEDKNAGEQANWSLTKRFLQSKAQQLGLPLHIEECDEEQLDLAEDAFSSDPAWAKQGSFLAEAPKGVAAGRLVIELSSPAKKAVQNFQSLCAGDKGIGKASKKPLHYKGCRFHRIVAGFVCQGGDIVRGDGSGSDSIYGGKFNDEKEGLRLSHDAQGVVAMANSGKNTNACQFYLTLAAAPQCDGKHVVVGRVTEGLHILERIEKEAASADGTPRSPVWIIDCGTP